MPAPPLESTIVDGTAMESGDQSTISPPTLTVSTTVIMAQDVGTLSLPAILVNPRDKARAAVATHAAHSAAHAQARREARSARDDPLTLRKPGEGARRLRRRENAALLSNPHAVRPGASDWLPPPPSHSRSFPAPAPRALSSTSAPSPAAPAFDGPSAHSGQFTLSLKGTRALLRKRGARAQRLVERVEGELVRWMEGLEEGNVYAREHGVGQARVLDSTPVNVGQSGEAPPVAPGDLESLPSEPPLPTPFALSSHSSPAALSTLLSSFYRSPSVRASCGPSARPAIVELTRAPGHLIWAVADSFERLIVHVLCRYYELASFSQTLPPSDPDSPDSYPSYRITHIVLPARLRGQPQRTTADPASGPHIPLTPENSDLSDLDALTGSDSASETATEVGVSDSEGESAIQGYRVPGDRPAMESDIETDSDAEVLLYTPARGRAQRTGDEQDATPVPPSRRDRSVDSDWSLAGAGTGNSANSATPSGWTSITTPQPLATATPPALHSLPSLARTISSDSAWAGSDTSDEGSLGSMMDSMTLEPAPTTAPASASAPFVSEFNIPLDAGHRTSETVAPKEVLKHRVSFFEYLYG